MVAGGYSLRHIMAEWGSTCNHNYLYRWLPCQYFILLMMGAWRPKHFEKVCSNKICTLLHQVGVLFNLIPYIFPVWVLLRNCSSWSRFSWNHVTTKEWWRGLVGSVHVCCSSCYPMSRTVHLLTRHVMFHTSLLFLVVWQDSSPAADWVWSVCTLWQWYGCRPSCLECLHTLAVVWMQAILLRRSQNLPSKSMHLKAKSANSRSQTASELSQHLFLVTNKLYAPFHGTGGKWSHVSPPLA